MRKSVCCALMMLAAAAMSASCFAAASPWDGTWKVNEAKSKFTGHTFTISEKGNMMHFSNGGPVEYDFACDGKDYQVVAEHTFTCVKKSERIYEMVSKFKGEELSRSKREFSADGKTMTIESGGKQPDGSAFTDKAKFVRVSGTGGMAGTWKSTNDAYSGTEVTKVSYSGGVMHSEDVSSKISVDAKMDGTPVTVTGPTVPAGVTYEAKADGPLSFHYVNKLNGKVTNEGVQTVSADGKTMTDTSWTPGKESEKTVVVYEKQ